MTPTPSGTPTPLEIAIEHGAKALAVHNKDLAWDQLEEVYPQQVGEPYEKGREDYRTEARAVLESAGLITALLTSDSATLRADRDRLREVAAELDRLCLVITSSVRFADPKNLPLIHKLVRDNREALQSSTGAA